MRSVCLFALLGVVAGQGVVIPEGMFGSWLPANKSTTAAVIGPSVLFSTFGMTRSKDEVWFSAIPGQVFRIKDGLMQYCFTIATSPFYVDVDHCTDTKVVFCYRKGHRMHTHRALDNGELATGCDAARIELELKGTTLEFTFYMSYPVKHAWVQLVRVGPPPPLTAYKVESVLGGSCDPTHPGKPTIEELMPESAENHEVALSSMCPKLKKIQNSLPAQPETATMKHLAGMACKQLDIGAFVSRHDHVDIRLQHTTPTSCWPCKVTYSVSAAIPENKYIAFGFKGVGYRNYLWKGQNPQRPNYFGMGHDQLDADRTTGVIVLGYPSSSGGCLREMKAPDYVGEPVDVEQPQISDASIARRGGRTTLRFSVMQHIARTPGGIWDFFNGPQISMRTMWAIGDVDVDDCKAKPLFHERRGVSPLGWFSQNPACVFDEIEFGNPEAIQATYLANRSVIV